MRLGGRRSSSNVEDRRGMGPARGGGTGFRIPMGMGTPRGGGGGLGIGWIVLIALVLGGIWLFTGQNPLTGRNDPALGLRFPDMSRAYDPELRRLALAAADAAGVALRRGVYVGVAGPSLETSAERRFLRAAGGDAVGMSTVVEVIAAVHAGMRVLGLSAITNRATGGPELTIKTVEKATGVRIDHYVEVNIPGFIRIVDAVGGVDVCVSEAVSDEDSGLDLPAGKYAFMCFMTDRAGGAPHAMQGMVQEINIS